MKKTITQIIDEYDSVNYSHNSDGSKITASLGVSFSGTNLYFAEAIVSDGEYKITNYGTFATNLKFGTGIEGSEKNIRDVYMFINGLVDSHNLNAKHLNLCLNTHMAVLHPIIIQGNVSAPETERFIRWEFEKQILEDISQYTINTLTLDDDPSGNSRLILVAGVRKKIADNFSNVLEKAKLKLENLDIDIFCSHTVYELNYSPMSDKLTLIADLKPGIAGILVCIGYEARFYYPFATSVKTGDHQLGDILNHHIDNLVYLFNNEQQTRYEVGRVLLCNSLAGSVLPHVDSRYRPECIDPFRKLKKPELYTPVESGENEPEKKESEKTPEESCIQYAESIGAAIKLLA